LARPPETIVFKAGVLESEKSANKRLTGRVAFCDPLVPLTTKLSGFAVNAVRLLIVSVLVCPGNMEAGLKEQVPPPEQERVILPVKLGGADAEKVKVACVLPITTVVVGVVDVIEKTASPVPERDTRWGLPTALSLMLNKPLRLPDAAGTKETLTVQLSPTLRRLDFAPQVLVSKKSPVTLI
jgi:hypothetical protein